MDKNKMEQEEYVNNSQTECKLSKKETVFNMLLNDDFSKDIFDSSGTEEPINAIRLEIQKNISTCFDCLSNSDATNINEAVSSMNVLKKSFNRLLGIIDVQDNESFKKLYEDLCKKFNLTNDDENKTKNIEIIKNKNNCFAYDNHSKNCCCKYNRNVDQLMKRDFEKFAIYNSAIDMPLENNENALSISFGTKNDRIFNDSMDEKNTVRQRSVIKKWYEGSSELSNINHLNWKTEMNEEKNTRHDHTEHIGDLHLESKLLNNEDLKEETNFENVKEINILTKKRDVKEKGVQTEDIVDSNKEQMLLKITELKSLLNNTADNLLFLSQTVPKIDSLQLYNELEEAWFEEYKGYKNVMEDSLNSSNSIEYLDLTLLRFCFTINHRFKPFINYCITKADSINATEFEQVCKTYSEIEDALNFYICNDLTLSGNIMQPDLKGFVSNYRTNTKSSDNQAPYKSYFVNILRIFVLFYKHSAAILNKSEDISR